MRWVALFVVVFLVSSGCFGPTQGWSLNTRGHIEQSNGLLVFHGSLSLDGMAENVTLTGVAVYFLDEERRVIKQIPIGRFGAGVNGYRDFTRFNVSFEQKPEYVLTTVETVDQPDSSEGTVTGLRRVDDGYTPYDDYDPFGDITPTYTTKEMVV